MDYKVEQSPALNMPQTEVQSAPNGAVMSPNGYRGAANLLPSPEGMLLPPAMPLAAPGTAQTQQGAQPLQDGQQQPFAQQSAQATQADDDAKSLDSEWVAKAKEIVEKTRTDPYVQTREISKVRYQYLKAQYNKDIKIAEEPRR